MLGEGSQLGDKCSVKRSVIGRHCRIGSNVKVIFPQLKGYIHVYVCIYLFIECWHLVFLIASWKLVWLSCCKFMYCGLSFFGQCSSVVMQMNFWIPNRRKCVESLLLLFSWSMSHNCTVNQIFGVWFIPMGTQSSGMDHLDVPPFVHRAWCDILLTYSITWWVCMCWCQNTIACLDWVHYIMWCTVLLQGPCIMLQKRNFRILNCRMWIESLLLEFSWSIHSNCPIN